MRSIILSTIMYYFFFVNSTYNSFAQACCSGGVPLAGSIGTGTATAKNLQVLITYDVNLLKDLIDTGTKLQDENRQRTVHSILTEFNYGISKPFTITTLFSYIIQQRKVLQTNGETDNLFVVGMGDMVFLLKYNLLWYRPGLRWSAAVGAGPKIPLGRSGLTDESDILLPADLQPGSGAWDGMFWFYAARQLTTTNPFRLESMATYRITGTNHNFYANISPDLGYKFGNEFQYIIGAAYTITSKWMMSDALLQVRYRSTMADMVGGSIIPNTGGRWLYLIPGINLQTNQKLSFRLTGEIPVYRHLTGTQLSTSYKFNISILYNYEFNKKDVETTPKRDFN